MTNLPDKSQVIEATFNEQIAIGVAMIAVCVVIHGIALFALQRLMSGGAAKERFTRLEALSFGGTLFTLAVVFALVMVHFVEIWIFAFLYDFLGALPNFQDSLYFSTISYSTVGYNDEAIAHEWRMVGAIESILGVIMLGWSTAFFVRFLKRLEDVEPRQRTRDEGD